MSYEIGEHDSCISCLTNIDDIYDVFAFLWTRKQGGLNFYLIRFKIVKFEFI